MTPKKIEETINLFATRFKLSVQHPEPHVYHIEGFELYTPGYNSVFDDTLPDFQVYRGVVIPGTRTMPNGDPGYPDDYDIVEIGTFITLLSALSKIGACLVEQWMDETGMYLEYAPETEDDHSTDAA